jgi:hypothetical protein
MRLYHMDLKFSMYKPEYIKKWFSKLMANGYDGVIIEIDNKLIFPSHPDFASKDALSAEEWYDIIRFGKDKGLVIYPLLQTLGHMEHILEYGEKYSVLAENPGKTYMLCPSKQSTLNFIKDLIIDLIEVFDKPNIIHLGGDEVYGHMEWKGIRKCPLCISKDSSEILNNFLINLAEFCIERGIRPEFWADEVLSFPEHIDRFPKGTRFIDWYYSRTERYSNVTGLIWGARSLAGEIPYRITNKIPERLNCMLPYLITEDGKFNNFYGIEYIISKGYEAVVASGVRFSGDCYSIPRIEAGAKNAGISEVVSRDLKCDHIVTSWAVRLSHPETTWPSLKVVSAQDHELASNFKEASLAGEFSAKIKKVITEPLGNINREQMSLLKYIAKGVRGIDITLEQNARFERPYYDEYYKAIYDIWESENRNDIVEMLNRRVSAGKEILPVLSKSFHKEKGDKDCIRHWINGIQLCMLRSEQAVTIIDSLTNGLNRKQLESILECNKILMTDFETLWSESVTEYSLEQEKEVKFMKDIRILNSILCK